MIRLYYAINAALTLMGAAGLAYIVTKGLSL